MSSSNSVDGEEEILHENYANHTEVFVEPNLFEEKETQNQPIDLPSKVIADQSMTDESDTCFICYEAWTTSGVHRICSLRCGHLFGRSCITKWLMSCRPKPGTCPQCNAKAHTKDIRVLYCPKIKAIDTTERDRALEDLEAERKLRKKIELELSEYKFKLELACSDVENLRDEINSLKAVLSASEHSRMPSNLSPRSKKSKISDAPAGSYVMIKSLNVSPTGQCRVLASYDYINLLCVSQASTNPLFKGFGIKKIHTGELRFLKYIHLHSKPIRDLAFHPEQPDAVVASASMDKSLKLTSLLVDQVVQTYQCSSPVWSCCWAFPSPNYLFAGCVDGSVYLFDIRVTSRPVSMFGISTTSTAPVIALRYFPSDFSNPTFRSGGLLAGQLTQVAFLEEAIITNSGDVGGMEEGRRYRSHLLPLQGSLVSLSTLHEDRGLFLASYRPTARVPCVRHLCTRLTTIEVGLDQSHGYHCESVANLSGGTQMRMLSRACLFRQEKSDQTLAVSGDDDADGALVWNCTTGSRIQALGLANATATSTPVIDVCAYNNGNNLALLTDRQVDIFQWS